jgi:twitching motility protein PilU
MDREKAIRFIHDLLKILVSKNGSDLFITVGAPSKMKIDGKMTAMTNQPLMPQHTQVLVRSIMNERKAAEFEQTQECNFAIGLSGLSRFRVNVFSQRSSVGMVLRVIKSEIPSFEQLNLPAVLKDIAMTKRGLVIFVGGTGSGKSSSLAAMIGYRNENSYDHIVTVEDPIEFVHAHKNCIVTQREVGADTQSYTIAFAETGHLCLSTLHANSSNQALDRIINFFPDEHRAQLLIDLSLNLKAVISQRLLPKASGTGRVPAIEIMLNTPLWRTLSLKAKCTR